MPDLKRFAFDELPADLAAALQARVARLGYFGEFFQCAAHQPDALKAFVDFTELAKAGVPKKLVEVVALTCAGWMGNAYEANQHERLSIRSGFGQDWLRALERLEPEAQRELAADEKLVQRFVLTTLDSRGHGARDLFELVRAQIGDAPAIAILMIVGRYVVHGLFVNTLGLAPPVPSIWEDGFQG
jgi:alkylhydroperoxidase family enzyme